jgi:hypothetical protein
MFNSKWSTPIFQIPLLWFPNTSLGLCPFTVDTNLLLQSNKEGYKLGISFSLYFPKYEGRLKSSWTHYSDSEVCGGAMTVSFSKYLPWQAMHFLQRSTHFSKTCCRPLITSKCLASELPFHGWESPEIAWGEIWTLWRTFWWGSTDPLFPSRTQNSIQISPNEISGLFQQWKWSFNGLQHVFEKSVERCKKCIACQGRYFKKETDTAPPQSSDSD